VIGKAEIVAKPDDAGVRGLAGHQGGQLGWRTLDPDLGVIIPVCASGRQLPTEGAGSE
jgi:hypothetical protein